MIRFFRVLGRVVGWLLRTRALRPLLALALFAWLFDGLVVTLTDAAWFSSVGLGALWREQFFWSASVGAVFIVVGLLAGIPLMRAVAHPVAKDSEEPSLPRAFARLQPMRARATRLGWLCIAGAAFFLGRGLGFRWNEFALASSAAPVHGADVADFWMTRAAALQSSLCAVWAFALVLGVVGLGVGVLRALPFLAAQPSVVPKRLLRALWGVGMTLCVLRALGFVFEAVYHAQIANDSSAAIIGFVALNGLGALGCAAIIVLLRRPRATLALLVVAVLILPDLGGDLLAPFVGRSSVLPPAPPNLEISSRPPDDWPQWDEATLVRAARIHLARDNQGHLVEWQMAGISERKGGRGNRADIVGTPVLTDEWANHGLTDREGEIAWESVDLPEQRAARAGNPLGPLFYGLTARPLLSEDARDVGVPFQSWLWKLAWAWRLRDPLLVIEGAHSQHLLVERGAREVGQRLAPFWTWGDVVARRDAQTGDAYFECVAYSVSARLPRRAPFESGVFAGQNSALPVAVLRLDARSGAIRVAPFASSNSLSLGTRWNAALPSLFGSNAPELAPTPALEVALAGGTSLVWIHTATGWEKKAVPMDLRDSFADKLDEFEGTARSNSPNHLEGATPMMWRQEGKLFLAQAFFDLTSAKTGQADANALPLVTGIAVGPLDKSPTQERSAQWSATFAGAWAALRTPNLTPSSNTSPFVTTTRPVRDIAREMLRAEQEVEEALKAGRYVEAKKLRAHMHDLLEQLAKGAH